MADSVDRVFGHALNTINKIWRRSARPPVADQLELYGLYKQAMEGDVPPSYTRPSAPSARKEADKHDAWAANRGLSRTEAKRRYIEKLLATMHLYASGTPEARELVAELEFVWDQVKNNVPSGATGGSDEDGSGENGNSPPRKAEGGLRVMSPTSQPLDDEDDDDGARDEFVDAPVSQFGEQGEDKSPGEGDSGAIRPRRTSVGDGRWRRRVESALVKLTTEVAALRELVETRQYNNSARRKGWDLLRWIAGAGWFAVKLVVADVFLLWLVILWLRRRKDRRLEGAIRVMLGDAQAVAKTLAAQMQNKLPHRKQ